jgi:hypothetical protein
MATVTKWLILRMSTAAQRNDLSPGQIKGITLGIANQEVSFHFNGPVIIDNDSGFRHCTLHFDRFIPDLE